jgi:sulfur-carrier protein
MGDGAADQVTRVEQVAGVAGTAGAAGVEQVTGTAGDVTVLFFAGAREATGVARATYGSAGSTVEQLARLLCSTYGPEFVAVMATCAIWVNGSPAPPGTKLRPGDEVAVLPPVSGG